MSNILQIHKYAYFVINDSDDLGTMENCLAPYGGIEAMEDVLIDYALDKRRISDLILRCPEGSVIYTPCLARVCKSLKELYNVTQLANKRSIEVIFCDKPSMSFSSRSTTGKINLAALQWAIDLDFDIRSENNKAAASKRIDEIDRKGHFTTSSGLLRTQWGGGKGRDLSAMHLASSKARTETAILWKENSLAVKFALRKQAEGWSVTQITNELGKLYDEAPDIYCTPTGKKPLKGTVSKWLKEANGKQT